MQLIAVNSHTCLSAPCVNSATFKKRVCVELNVGHRKQLDSDGIYGEHGIKGRGLGRSPLPAGSTVHGQCQ